MSSSIVFYFFFFNDTATTEIYTLSLHDALPICTSLPTMSDGIRSGVNWMRRASSPSTMPMVSTSLVLARRSEEHTSELQSPCNLVCRLLLEKKKKLTKSPGRCGITLAESVHDSS